MIDLRCTLTCLVIGAATLQAAERPEVDRTIGKEPEYQSKSPRYGLVLFGPKSSSRVWIVKDGDQFYIDPSGAGDLTGDGKRLTIGQRVAVTAKEGVAPKTELEVRLTGPTARRSLLIYCTAEGLPAQVSSLVLGESPRTAPIIPFQGPLSLFLNQVPTLKFGEKGAELMVYLGTPCIGVDGNVRVLHERVPKDFHPVADIEFPPANMGGEPIRQRLVLNGRCCDDLFLGDIRLPEKVGLGAVKVTLSFADWKDGKVSPNVVKIPLEAAKK